MTPKHPSAPRIKGHPLALASFPTWVRVLAAHGGVDREHLASALRITLISLLTAPLRATERVVTAPRVRRSASDAPTVFLVGFWRSGTTHLHNLFTCDDRLGYVTQYQTMAPDVFLLGERFLKAELASRLGDERPQDRVKLAIDTPQEEEFALSCVSPLAFYHAFLYFPSRIREDLARALLLDGLSAAQLEGWQRAYRRILAKASAYMEGRPLVVKNPPNLARLEVLRRTFSGAKFVHIHRSPFEVIPSLHHTLAKLHERFALQSVDRERLSDDVFHLYERMFERFLRDAARLPAGAIAEVRYEDLDRDPVAEVGRIYDELGLPGYEAMRPRLEEYVDGQRSYRKNRYQLDGDTVATIARRCRLVLDHWNYQAPAIQQPALNRAV